MKKTRNKVTVKKMVCTQNPSHKGIMNKEYKNLVCRECGAKLDVQTEKIYPQSFFDNIRKRKAEQAKIQEAKKLKKYLAKQSPKKKKK